MGGTNRVASAAASRGPAGRGPARLLTVALTAAVLIGGLTATSASAGVHKGNYTCYQHGTLYWGYLEIKGKNRYEIPYGSGKFKKKGSKLKFKSGSLKKWGWKGKYSTGRSPGGEKEWQIDLKDPEEGLKINCYD